jgi:hypothetical protein
VDKFGGFSGDAGTKDDDQKIQKSIGKVEEISSRNMIDCATQCIELWAKHIRGGCWQFFLEAGTFRHFLGGGAEGLVALGHGFRGSGCLAAMAAAKRRCV